jgi:hypothetical protein
MNEKLTPDDLFAHAAQHRQVAVEAMKRRGILQAQLRELIDTGAPLSERRKIEGQIQDINTRITQVISKAQDLDTQAIRDILVATNLQEAKERIEKATEKVLEAVKNLNDIREVFQVIDLFIRLGGAIVSAAITGSPAAQIKAIVEAIDALS